MRNEIAAGRLRDGASVGGRGRRKQIAFGSARPIIAALAERGDAVNDRVYKVIRRSCNLL
jgi:hypothetical protein